VHQWQGVSGRERIIDTTQQAATGTARSTPFFGREVGNDEHRVWVQRAMGGGDEDWERDREHLRSAYRTGQIEVVAACLYIAAPIDLIDGGWDVYTIAEIAGTVLDRELRSGPLSPGEVDKLDSALRGALHALHSVGLVHSDVREDNVLCLDGDWKLADLGGVVERGTPIRAIQKDRAYVRGGAELGASADPKNDLYALGGMRHFDAKLDVGTVLGDGAQSYRVERVEQPANPNALGRAWVTRVES
jgi:hypothetical protein